MRLALFLLALTHAGVQAQPTFKVDVQMVHLLVNVKNPAGELAGSLDRDEFTIYDCGVKQEISVFERYTSRPLLVSLLVDISGSTAKDLRYEVVSITKFLNALFGEGNPKDLAALYSFNYQVTLNRSFTRRQKALEDDLKLLKAEGGTSLYDAIYLASEDLQGREGRRVIVVVTDGGDTTSNKKYREALEAAQRADALIYPIVVIPITNDAGRNIGGEHALETLASGTGGRIFAPNVGEQLDRAFSEILRDLRAQYMIGYYPRNLPKDAPRFHVVKVELKRKDLRAVTRTGYYGDSIR
jgi:Ca-activated chloride channel family protein